jgi:hypothetical protein
MQIAAGPANVSPDPAGIAARPVTSSRRLAQKRHRVPPPCPGTARIGPSGVPAARPEPTTPPASAMHPSQMYTPGPPPACGLDQPLLGLPGPGKHLLIHIAHCS